MGSSGEQANVTTRLTGRSTPKINSQACLQHGQAFGKTDGLSAQPFQMGAQVQVVPFDVSGVDRADFVDFWCNQCGIDFESVCADATWVFMDDKVSECPKVLFCPGSNPEVHYLFRCSVEGIHDPSFICLPADEGPQFIDLIDMLPY